jgi:hypothetical protein
MARGQKIIHAAGLHRESIASGGSASSLLRDLWLALTQRHSGLEAQAEWIAGYAQRVFLPMRG